MKNGTTSLDLDELLHLALADSEQGRFDDALARLKKVITAEPNNARAYYLMGAVHAQIGMFDRAAEEMTKALHIEPGIDAARFQLGLLHISSGRVEEAAAVWAPLEALGAEHPLYLFKTGLLHLAKDEFRPALDNLEKGIALNRVHLSLNKDMQKVIDSIKEARPEDAADQSEAAKASGGRHVLVSSYEQDTDDKNS